MKRIFAALILSTATVGVAQANELGYPPPPQSGGAYSQQQVRSDMNQPRGQQAYGTGQRIEQSQASDNRYDQMSRDQMHRDRMQHETEKPRRQDLNDWPFVNG